MQDIPLSLLLISSGIKILVITHMLLIGVMAMIWAERRVSGWVQDRHGPNRVGPAGILQPIADGIKFLLKEDLTPDHVDKTVYWLAPAMIVIPALITCGVVPYGDLVNVKWGDGVYQIPLQIADINIGILYILAISSLGVYGVVLGAWASNNKYSFLGGLRASAQMISYELSLGLSLVGVLMLTGSISLREISESQDTFLHWNFLTHFPAFVVFTIAMFAETNRLPFDLAEAEQELVGGYHTEYSSMKFAMFFMAEYMHMITGSVVAITLFLGGWHFFGLENIGESGSILNALITFSIVFFKMGGFLFFFIWVRWSMPRFRYDQLMNLGWKILMPIAISSILTTAILWHLADGSRLVIGIGNLVVGFVVIAILASLVGLRSKDESVQDLPSFVAERS